MTGFQFRCIILVVSVAVLILTWAFLRPSRTHLLAALPGAVVGAFADWWVEVILNKAGVWQHIGGKDWLTVLNVPMEMPISFIPAGLAGLMLLSVGTRFFDKRGAAITALVLYIGWCILGIVTDAINLHYNIGLASTHTLSEIAFLYIVPFWFLISAVPPFFYWLVLKIIAPEETILDTRGKVERINEKLL